MRHPALSKRPPDHAVANARPERAPGKYRFKIKRGRPHPDELKITLTGNPIPDTMRRAAEWSAERHGFRKSKERVGPFRPKLP